MHMYIIVQYYALSVEIIVDFCYIFGFVVVFKCKCLHFIICCLLKNIFINSYTLHEI